MQRRVAWLTVAGLLAATALIVLAFRSVFDAAAPPTADDPAPQAATSPPAPLAAPAPLPSAAPAPIEALASAAVAPAAPDALDDRVARRAALPGAVAARFTGRVVEVDGSPVAGAAVSYVAAFSTLEALGVDPIKPAADGRASAGSPPVMTGDEGTFVLDDYHVPEAPRPPRLTNEVSDPLIVVTKAGRATYVRACLGFRGGEFDTGTLVLEPGVAVTGRLVDEEREPIAGRIVSATCWTATSTVTRPERSLVTGRSVLSESGADGRFTLEGLWPGQISLWVLDEGGGYLKFLPGRTLEAGAVDLGDVGLARTRGRTLTGSVVDETGRPVAGAEVLLAPANMPAMALMTWGGASDPWPSLRRMARGVAQCDESGRFTLQAAKVGAAGEAGRLHVRAPGHAVASLDIEPKAVGPFEIVAPTLGAWRISVFDGRTSTPVPVDAARLRALAHAASPALEGAVPPADQPWLPWRAAPAIGTEVEVLRADEPGTWLIEDPGEASTDLIVEADGLGTIVRELPGIGRGRLETLTLTLEAETILAVEVQDAGGSPIPQARIVVEPADDGLALHFHREGQTDAEGLVRVGGLGPGEWRVRTSATGFAAGEPSVVTVAATPGEVRTLIVLERVATIRGMVLEVDGGPAAGCDVRLSRADSPPGAQVFGELVARTDPLGAFLFDAVEPGAYKLGTALADDVNAEVAAGESATVQLQRGRPPVVRGRVLSGGEPIEGAGLYPMPGGGGFWDITDASGEYELRLPGAGMYEIDAYPPAGPGAAWGEFMVDARWNETVTLDIELGGGRVRGEVVDAVSGRPIEAARLILVPGQGSESPLGSTSQGVSTHADESGRFLFRPVRDGWYRVVARGAGHAEARTEPFEVSGGVAASDIRLAMQPGRCSLSVTLVDQWGQPVGDQLRLAATQGEQRVEAEAGTPGIGVFFRYEPGLFVFEDLAPGRHELILEPVPVPGDDDASVAPALASEQVELEPGEVRSMQLRLAPGR